MSAASETSRSFAARIAREAFAAGLRAAGQPRSEIERQSVRVQELAQELLAGVVDAEVERRWQADGDAA